MSRPWPRARPSRHPRRHRTPGRPRGRPGEPSTNAKAWEALRVSRVGLGRACCGGRFRTRRSRSVAAGRRGGQRHPLGPGVGCSSTGQSNHMPADRRMRVSPPVPQETRNSPIPRLAVRLTTQSFSVPSGAGDQRARKSSRLGCRSGYAAGRSRGPNRPCGCGGGSGAVSSGLWGSRSTFRSRRRCCCGARRSRRGWRSCAPAARGRRGSAQAQARLRP